MLLRLVIQQQRNHPVRFLATLLALAASVGSIVWLAGGYETLFASMDQNAKSYMGRFGAFIAPAGATDRSIPTLGRKGIPEATITKLSQLDNVSEVNAQQQTRVAMSLQSGNRSTTYKLMRDRAPILGAPPLDPALITTTGFLPPYDLAAGNWLSNEPESKAIVVSENVASRLGANVGDTVRITTEHSQTEWTIAGIVEQPPDVPTMRNVGVLPLDAVYVNPEQHKWIHGTDFLPTNLQVALKSNSPPDLTQSLETIRAFIDNAKLPYQVIDEAEIEKGLAQSRTLEEKKSSTWTVALFASLASLIVIGAVMNATVRERVKELAMLRAIGWSRGQIAASLLLESVLLGLLGWILGIFAGHLFVQYVTKTQLGAEYVRWIPGWFTLGSSAICVVVGVIGASLIPIWRACRVSPIDAMVSGGELNWSRSFAATTLFLAILFLGFGGIVTSGLLTSNEPDNITWFRWVAYPSFLLGIACLVPWFVYFGAASIGRGLGKLFGVDSEQFTRELQSKIPHWTSMTVALSVGLSLLLATQIWGGSMLQTFLPGKWIPDGFIAIRNSEKGNSSIPRELWSRLSELKSIKADSITPLYADQCRLLWPGGKAPGKLEQGYRDNFIVIGLPLEKAFSGPDPLIKIEWVQGSREEAIPKMRDASGCVVSEDFIIQSGLAIGDVIPLDVDGTAISTGGQRGKPAEVVPGETTELKIVGVVRMTGWHWLTKFTGLRTRYGGTGGIVFSDAKKVQTDFKVAEPKFCWFNVQSGTDLDGLEKEIQSIAFQVGGPTGGESVQGAEGSAQSNAQGVPWMQFTPRQWIDDGIRIRASGMLWGMCYLPLYAMLLFAVAVACSMFSSVRMRSWEFGVIRSLGFSRWYLVRWVTAEGLFLAIIACLASLTFGLIAGWGGLEVARFGGFYAGPPPWTFPVREVALGFSIALVLCLISVILPAWFVGTQRPLALLQSRSSSKG